MTYRLSLSFTCILISEEKHTCFLYEVQNLEQPVFGSPVFGQTASCVLMKSEEMARIRPWVKEEGYCISVVTYDSAGPEKIKFYIKNL
jgi:hypothetical protein